MIAIGLIGALVPAIAVALLLGMRSLAELALATYVLTCAIIVLGLEGLSAFRGVSERNVLAAEIVLAVASAGALWLRRHQIGIDLPSGLGESLGGRPVVVVLLVVVAIALGYELALALFTPPNNWDSLAYHLSRAAAWYQHHQISYVTSHTERENANPPNGEILVLFTFLFAHSDRFAAFSQWAAEVAAMVAVFVIARRIGADRSQGLLAALLFACLSQVAVQSVTTQNDLVIAAFVVAAVAFLTSDKPAHIVLGATAAGLAVGTKFSGLFALPVIVMIALVAVPRRSWLRLGGALLAGIAVFGAFGYALNMIHTGHLAGASSATKGLHQHGLPGFGKTVGGVLLGIAADLRGAPAYPANEDTSYFGLLGLVLLLPVVVLTLRRSIRHRACRLEMALALALPVYVVALAVTNVYNAFLGRFVMTAAAVTAPLFSGITRWERYTATVVAIATLSVTGTLLFDHAKPSGINGGPSIWSMTRSDAQALQRPAMRPVLEAVSARVPASARVGYLLGVDDWDYPLYGLRLNRRLVHLDRGRPYAEADDQVLHWILVRTQLAGPPPSGWRAFRFPAMGLMLLERSA